MTTKPKDWSSCPGNERVSCGLLGGDPDCFSYSNDAALLLPSTAMTTFYRVIGFHAAQGTPTVLSVTATAPDTNVTLYLPTSGRRIKPVASGQTIPTPTDGKLTLKLAKAGDVAQFVSQASDTADFSGTLVETTKPVQVITSVPCTSLGGSCDHIEESVLPAETLGRRYIVAPPTGPDSKPVRYQVRLYGNQDGTTLSYLPAKPAKCPDVINAGQVVDCGENKDSFEVVGDKEFGVATFQLSGAAISTGGMGDPSQSLYASVEQFRTKYVFLAPDDYPVQFADITATQDAEIELDGKSVAATWTKIGSGDFGILRVDLTKSGNNGAHTLTSKKGVGLQVIGYGTATSFQYPGGLNLKQIAPPPQPK
jgi:hypothetical protein